MYDLGERDERASNCDVGQPKIGSYHAEGARDAYDLHSEHVNPRFAKAMTLIGFNRTYVRGEGSHLWDDKGAQYLDMLAGYGVFNVGRNNPQIKAALAEYLNADFAGLVQMEAPVLSGVLAKRLKALTPNKLDNVYFTSTGAEGVETAIKFARCATKRTKIVYAVSAFHGLTNGALAVNGTPCFKEPFGGLIPDCEAVPFDDLDALEEHLSKRDVAAFIVEPIQGKTMKIFSPGYLAAATQLCRRFGTLLVIDEVQTGLGRTGKMFAYEYEPDADPDIVVISKALSGGFVPVGAVLYRKSIYDKVFNTLDNAAVHSSTFGQGGFAMAAGLATLDVLEDQQLPQHAKAQGDKLGARLQALQPKFEFLKDVRWRGLMLGIEFGSPKSLRLKAAWTLAHSLNDSLFCQATTIPLLDKHHILTQISGPGTDVIKLIPPLTFSDDDIDWFVSAFEQVMSDLHTFPGPAWETITTIGKNAAKAALAVKSSAA